MPVVTGPIGPQPVGITSGGTITGNLALVGTFTQTSASATAFASGPNGATNPVFLLNNSTASQADGISVTGGAVGTGTTIAALSSGADSGFIHLLKGAGSFKVWDGATIDLEINRGGNGRVEGQFYDRNATSAFGLDSGGLRLGGLSAVTTGIGFSNSSFWYDTLDTFIRRGNGAANVQLGAVDAAAAVAQKFSVQNVVAGTNNTAGANFTIAGSQSTGSAAGGSLIFQTAPAGGAGSSQNALVTALTIDSTKLATFAGAATVTTNLSTPIIRPPSDSTTALQITKTDGTTRVVDIDTTNARVGINKTPGAFDLDVNGATNLGSTLAVTGAVTQTAKTTTYNNETTAGEGLAPIRGFTSQRTVTNTGDTNLLTVTPASAAGTYRITVSISLTSATSGVVGWTATWTDSNGNAQTPTNLSLFQSGAAAPALTFTTSAATNYYGTATIEVNNAGTNIVIKQTGSGTYTGKSSASIERIN